MNNIFSAILSFSQMENSLNLDVLKKLEETIGYTLYNPSKFYIALVYVRIMRIRVANYVSRVISLLIRL